MSVKRSGDPELVWANKRRHLVAAGEAGYVWADSLDALEPVRAIALRGPAGGTTGSESNLVIVGDAADAMHALQRDEHCAGFIGQVRLVYIDPPYNTGNAFAQYDDALDHAMWLSMFRDRILAVRPLLAPDASVWVHLDDAEAHHARCVLDEVFGPDAFVATIVWQKRTTRESRKAFSSCHDYIHVYAPAGPKAWKMTRNLLEREPSEFHNRDGDPRGPWADAPFTAPGYRPNQQYPITNPAGDRLLPPKGRSWYATEPVFERLTADNRIWFPRGGAGLPRMKMFPSEVRGLVPFSMWGSDECGTNDDAKRHLMGMFPALEAFATPKPEALLERIIHIATSPGDLVLDCFAGSGTTPAVAHKMERRWIAVERSGSTVADYLVPRLDRVVRGVDAGGVTESTAWKGGGSFGVLEVGAGEAGDALSNRIDAYFETPPDQRDEHDVEASDAASRPCRRSQPAEVLSLFYESSEDEASEVQVASASGSVVA